MEWLIVIGVIVWLIVRSTARRRQLVEMGERLVEAENRLDRLEQQFRNSAQLEAPVAAQGVAAAPREASEAATPAGPPELEPVIPVPAAPELARAAPPRPSAPPPQETRATDEALVPLRAPSPPPVINERWQRYERLFMENWTGILGSVVVVAGVTFVGIYAALQLAPFYRFLMTVAAAGALGGASFLLRRREAWRALAEWVRSAAAAIFLFACAASGGLPGLGLQWIESAVPALALLLFGVAVNLYLSWIASAQTFASLHVVLSVLPLTIVQQSTMSLGIVSVVALFGVLLSFRARWDQHLLIVILTCVLYHISWYQRLRIELETPWLRYFGALNAMGLDGVRD